MKILRALPQYLFGELRDEGDVNNCDPGEMLVLPYAVCKRMAEKPSCLCGRSFVGVDSCLPTTLAVVCEDDDTYSYSYYRSSRLANGWWGENNHVISSNHMNRIAAAADPFQDGQIIRVRLLESAQMQIYPLQLQQQQNEQS